MIVQAISRLSMTLNYNNNKKRSNILDGHPETSVDPSSVFPYFTLLI